MNVAHLVFRSSGPALCGATNPAADYAPDAPACGPCQIASDRWNRNHVSIWNVGDPARLRDGSVGRVVRVAGSYPIQDIYVLAPEIGVIVANNLDLAYVA